MSWVILNSIRMEPANDLIDYMQDRSKAVRKFHNEFLHLMKVAKGSSHNHQAWEGGYLDHIGETMRIAIQLHRTFAINWEPFPLSSALIVLYFHDIEKIWKYSEGKEIDKVEWLTKILPEKYEIVFTPEELNALQYIHGEGADYSKSERKMNELAAFCHSCDVLSARLFHDRGQGRGLQLP